MASSAPQHIGPGQHRGGNQSAGAWLARLLRSLLSLRAALPRLAHRPASRSMGQAQVQTTQVHPRRCMGLAGCRQTARAGTICALAGSAGTERPTCKSRMTGDCHVRFCERRGVRFPPATRPPLTFRIVARIRTPAVDLLVPRRGGSGRPQVERSVSCSAGPAAVVLSR